MSGEATELFAAAASGDRRSLGRLLTMVERGGACAAAVAELAHPAAGRARLLGVTGSPGAGKSTLVGRLAAVAAGEGLRVAVLAVDPSSPQHGGAILGDRIRMDAHVDAATFIRSVATRGAGGGLAVAVPELARVLDAVGYDVVVIETVGVGQVEVAVAGAADTTVVVVTPGWGDAVQANKAGLLEVGDVFAVNKADRPGASDARRDLELMLDLGPKNPTWRPPIVLTVSTEGCGVEELWEAMGRHDEHLRASGELQERRQQRWQQELRDHVERELRDRAERLTSTPAAAELLGRIAEGGLTPQHAARLLLEQERTDT